MAKDFRPPVELLVLVSFKGWKEGSRSCIRVVQWLGEKGRSYVRLEKREFYIDKATDAEKMGKAQGFSIKEIETIILPRIDEIKTVMHNPPPPPEPEPDVKTEDLPTGDAQEPPPADPPPSDPPPAEEKKPEDIPTDDQEEIPF